jgi:hypothetical protein
MGKTMIMQYECGGFGRQWGQLIRERLSAPPGFASRMIETDLPAGVPAARCVVLAPQLLPLEAEGSFLDVVRMAGIEDSEDYRSLRELVSQRGLSRCPGMGWIAAMQKLMELRDAIESDARSLSQRLGGAERCFFITCSSALGGTGLPSARAAGCAFRLAALGAALPSEARWLHVLVTSAIAGDACRSRRTLALEHRALTEFQALMRSGAELTLPGQIEPIRPPGPDDLVLIASSAEAPRTMAEAADEFAAIIDHWLN